MRALERLEAEGMLSGEGRDILASARPTARGGGARTDRGRVAHGPARGDDRGPRAPRKDDWSPREDRGPRSPRPAGPVKLGGPTFRTAAGPVQRPSARQLTAPEAQVAERLHKVMAHAGLASRRHSEELIQAGRVKVNGQVVTELGTKVIPGKDRIEVDDRPLGTKENPVYVLLNKPKGYVTTLFDPQGRETVVDLLGGEIAQRVYPVGRLDYDTEGLLLLTNDGDLANAIMHPARMVKKTYIAKVRGVPGPAKIKALEEGIELEDGPTAPAEVKLLEAKGPNAATLSIRIHEGRNRQVRRMLEAVGHEVIHLKRTTLGPLTVGELPVGHWRDLSEQELKDLKRSLGLEVKPNRGAKVAAIVAGRRGVRGAARFGAEGEGRDFEEGPRPARPGARPSRPAGPGARPGGGPGRPARPAGTGRPAFKAGPGRPAGPGRREDFDGTEGRPARPAGPGARPGARPGGGPGRPARPAGPGRPGGPGRSAGPARDDGPLGMPVMNGGAEGRGPARKGPRPAARSPRGEGPAFAGPKKRPNK